MYPLGVAVISSPDALSNATSPTIICLETPNSFAILLAETGLSLLLIISIILVFLSIYITFLTIIEEFFRELNGLFFPYPI